jgi:plastocyanin
MKSSLRRIWLRKDHGGRRCTIKLTLALLLVLPASLFAEAEIEGRVALPKGRSAPVLNQRYEIVSKAGVLSTNPPVAVVYLAGNFPKPTAPVVAQITQKDLMFLPSLLPVRVGTKVEFPNLDDTYHNIFSFSPPKRFDLGRYRANENPIPSVVFDTPGLVTLRCDIHEHMRALILVLDTPHFVVTDADGRFRMKGLPAGSYTLTAWVNSKSTRDLAVELRDGEVQHVDFGAGP